MKTVKYFKDLGLEFVEGDTCANNPDNKTDMIRMRSSTNNPVFDDSAVGEFAWRTNTGEKPAFTGEIEVMHKDKTQHTNPGSQVRWGAINTCGDIIKWRPSLSNKDESTAKNVVDAVNELDCDLSNTYCFDSNNNETLYYSIPCGFYVTFSKDVKASPCHQYICAVEEFNQCIEDMSTNYGRCSQTYAEYKEECKSSFAVVDESPAFTQEMVDNGVLPSVGMECLVLYSELHNAEYEKCTIDFVGSHVVVYSSESCTERTAYIELVDFKPIYTRTDKEKAIDYMQYAYDKGNNMAEVLSEIEKGYVKGVSFSN